MNVILTAEQKMNAGRSRAGVKNGCLDVVRQLLAERGPMTLENVSGLLAGVYSLKQIKRCLNPSKLAKGIYRSAVSDGVEHYAIEPFEKPMTALQWREFRPLQRDPFEAWKLCQRDPYERSIAAVKSHAGCA